MSLRFSHYTVASALRVSGVYCFVKIHLQGHSFPCDCASRTPQSGSCVAGDSADVLHIACGTRCEAIPQTVEGGMAVRACNLAGHLMTCYNSATPWSFTTTQFWSANFNYCRQGSGRIRIGLGQHCETGGKAPWNSHQWHLVHRLVSKGVYLV